MQTDNARLAVVEARVEEQGHMLNGLKDAIASLEARMDRRFEAMDRRFEAVDRRFDQIEQRFIGMDARFTAIEQRFNGVEGRFVGIDQRLEGLDAKMSRQFVWLVGIQVTSLIAIVGALGGVIAALVAR